MRFGQIFLMAAVLCMASCDKTPQNSGSGEPSPGPGDTPVQVIPSGAMAVVEIVTEDNAPIVSKEEYISATVTVREGDEVVENIACNIRGRGNSSWYNAEKKSYRLKFEEKTSLLGRPKDKSWSLVANYFDKTLLRNELAFYMSRMSRFAYTPDTDYVEVYLNGSYEGVYVLCDHLKTGSHRVDADYLMEIDVRAEEEDIKLTVPNLGQPVVVKDPDDISYESQEYLYISEFLNSVDALLYSDMYSSASAGYVTCIDVDSFVDWYLINEIAKNNDAVLYTSCYMNHSKGGKLFMGPVWDFDIAFGNVNYNDNDKPEGLWIAGATWYSRLLSDRNFQDKVKERFLYYYGKREDLYEFIDGYAAYLKPYVDRNEERWHNMNQLLWANNEVFETYQEYIDSLKNWLERRFEWMKENYGL